MKKIISGLLLLCSLTVSYTVKAKRQSNLKTIQALQAQDTMNGLKTRLNHAQIDRAEVKEKMDASIPKNHKRRLQAIQNKITRLQKQLANQRIKEQDVRDKMDKSISPSLKKQSKAIEAEISYLTGQIAIHMKHLTPYFTSSKQAMIVA